MRRFTRRSRHRRAASLTAAGLVVVLVASVLVAVFSPLLALRTVTVEGAERVDPAAVQAALGDQMGTPLALLDFDEVERSLEAFPLIASYVTETAPPDTLVVRISERQPVATVAVGDGFDLVDPAGVVVQRLGARPEGVPLVDVGAAEVDGPLFRAVGEVLLGLPVQLRATVDTATASTPDDVTLTLTTGERVVWGSADESARKAQVLAGLVADQARRDPGADVEYDVSAPDAGIIRGK
ncbi:cell division protein FtsQ/DivIB [Frigoribacterium salinisoli]